MELMELIARMLSAVFSTISDIMMYVGSRLGEGWSVTLGLISAIVLFDVSITIVRHVRGFVGRAKMTKTTAMFS